jgi:hypothetical protein
MNEVKLREPKPRLLDDPDYYKKYYLANKDKFKAQNEKRKNYVKHCDVCNTDVGLKNFSQHLTTAKHQRNATA